MLLVCDPEPNALDPYAEPSRFLCEDAAKDAFRVLAALAAPPTRLYLRYSDCTAIPCSPALDAVTVTGWASGAAWTTVLRVDADGAISATPPAPDPAAAMPELEAPAPAVSRPRIPGAPTKLASRTPYPYCGAIGVEGHDIAKQSCFVAAVLGGRRAELVVHQAGTEGQSILEVLRAADGAAPIMYTGSDGRWVSAAQSLIVPAATGYEWGFSPWPEDATAYP